MPAITGVEFREFSAAHHNADRNWLLVVLKTDDPAIVGLGDASPMDYAPQVKGLVEQFVERYMIGRDPWDSHALWMTIYHDANVRGGRLAQTALAGLDIALWDIKGKLAGLPVYKLLGGALRDKLRVYANGWYSNPGTPQQNADEARALVDRGYTGMKFDPFGYEGYYQISREDENMAVAKVAAVRQAVGPDVDIMVEAHARWDPMNAIQIGKRMEAFRPFWYEEPVSYERVCELADVRSKVDIPIATGEKLYNKFVFAEIVEAHAADVLQPDIANCGGITELVKIAHIAEVKHITMAPHNVCSPVGAMAELHVGAAITNFEIEEFHAEFYSPHYYTVCDGFPRPEDGYVTLSDAPGLGLTLNEDVIAAHPKLAKVSSKGGRRKRI